jgi:SAM-dependent methyltransferase
MTGEQYHKYVFDLERREFVGQFEEMYANEEKEGFDSWHQDNENNESRRIALFMIEKKVFKSVLDIGCGKGTFTRKIKTETNKVLGVDVSTTAVAKARQRYPYIDFKVATVEETLTFSENWDAVLCMEVLSYLPNWRAILEQIAEKTRYLFVGLFLPEAPIGFVKNFQDLRKEIQKNFIFETELLWNEKHIYILAKSKRNIEKEEEEL